MKRLIVLRRVSLLAVFLWMPVLTRQEAPQAQTIRTDPQTKPSELQISGAPLALRVLVQSPAESDTDLQIICLFASAAENPLHGALVELDEKTRGLLVRLRNPSLFRGELGESLLLLPPAGTLLARKLLIIGLGDSETFVPQRMELVGAIVYRESNRLGIAHPFFAPTILDGGVTKFATGDIAQNFTAGLLRAARTEAMLQAVGASAGHPPLDLTYLAGQAHATDTQQGIVRAVSAADK
jgi:hypothetical protein